MKKQFFCLCTFALSLFVLVSCKKDHVSPNDPLIGDWKFMGIHANYIATAQYFDGGSLHKSVTTSDYRSTENTGTTNFNGSTFSGNGLSYKISLMALDNEFIDNQLIDTFSMPYDFTIPLYSATASYKIIGQDSIRFTNGEFFGGIAPSSNIAANTYKFSISGNDLVLAGNIIKDSTFDYGGIPISQHEFLQAQINLQRP